MSTLGWCLDHPDDVPSRLLYADRLAEQGAPEAVLYGLSAKASLSGPETTERARVYGRWGHRLLGPLTEIVDPHTVHFEAGFPVEAEIRRDHDRRAAERCRHRRWATLRRIRDHDARRLAAIASVREVEVRAPSQRRIEPVGSLTVVGRYGPGSYLVQDQRLRPWRLDVFTGERLQGACWGLAPVAERREGACWVQLSVPGPRRRLTRLPPAPGAAMALAARYLQASLTTPFRTPYGFSLATDGELVPTCPAPLVGMRSAPERGSPLQAPEEALGTPTPTSVTYRAGQLVLHMLGIDGGRVHARRDRHSSLLKAQLARVPGGLRARLARWLHFEPGLRPGPLEVLGALTWNEADLEPVITTLDRGGPWGSVAIRRPLVLPEGAPVVERLARLEAR